MTYSEILFPQHTFVDIINISTDFAREKVAQSGLKIMMKPLAIK